VAASFGCRAPPLGQGKYAQDSHFAVQRKSYHASDMDLVAVLFDTLTVDADMPFVNDALGQTSAFRQTNEEKKTVDPHCWGSSHLPAIAVTWILPDAAQGEA
jgi:hypothetical protein